MTAIRALRFPIRAVARMTGLPLDTLRAWERRYQVVTPTRTGRGRLYSQADVQRLKQLASLVGAGHGIGSIADRSDAELARLAVGSGDHRRRTMAREVVDLEPLTRAVRQYDLPSIEELLTRHSVLLPADTLIFAVVLPVLREVGARWEAGAIRPAHEHLVSAIIRSVLGGLLRTMPWRGGDPTMVLATISGERHELGLLCAAVLAARAGCNVVYLGPDLPGADLLHAATRLNPGIVLLSATTPGSDVRELLALKKLKRSVEIWVGGPERGRVREAIGARVRSVDTLERLAGLVATAER